MDSENQRVSASSSSRISLMVEWRVKKWKVIKRILRTMSTQFRQMQLDTRPAINIETLNYTAETGL